MDIDNIISDKHLNPVSDSIKKELSDICSRFSIEEERLDEDELYTTDEFREMKERMYSELSIQWKLEGSRDVLGLGRTFNGTFIHNSNKRIVAKVTPVINKDYDFSVLKDENHREILIWEVANLIGDEHFFNPIIDTCCNGRMIFTFEKTPVYYSKNPLETEVGSFDYIVDGNLIRKHTDIMEENGWEGLHDTKHGNIGIDKNKSPVRLDYGSFVKINKSELDKIPSWIQETDIIEN